MQRRTADIRRAGPAALAVAGVLAVSLLTAPAAGASTHAAGQSHRASAVGGFAHIWSQQQTLAYWTPARLRATAGDGIMNAGPRPRAELPAGHPTGNPASVPGGLPRGPGSAPIYRGPAPRPARITSSYTYRSFSVPAADYTKYPYSVNGRLFFTRGKGSGSCSGTVVGSYHGSKDENEIWTAGHCLAENGVMDSSAVFIPAYNGNKSDSDPFGKFTWNGGWESNTAWIDNGDATEDEAAMTFGTSSTTGKNLGNAVGWDGFAWNWPVNENFTAFGYPGDPSPPYNGKSMIEDIAPTAGQDSISGANPVEPIFIGNPMTFGSSGGAWNVDWTSSSPGYVDGHNDYGYSSQPDAVYSPYQDTLSNEVRCFGASSC